MIAFRLYRQPNSIIVENSLDETVETADFFTAIEFLMKHSNDSPPQFLVTWDITCETTMLLSLLDRDKLQDFLAWNSLARHNEALSAENQAKKKELKQSIDNWLFPYNVSFRQDRYLRISKGSWTALVYSLEQFRFDEAEPQTVKDIARIGEALLSELRSLKYPIEPTSLTSAAKIIEPLLKAQDLPAWDDCPSPVIEGARFASRRPWVEAHCLGYAERTWCFDQTAAYLGQIADLIDFREKYGDWIEAKVPPKKAYYGWAFGKVHITSDVSPCVWLNHGDSLNPKGEWPDWLPLQEIRHIQEYSRGSFEVERGYWFTPRQIRKPLDMIANWIFKLRDNPILRKSMKLGGNAIWGKLVAEYAEFDDWSNPVWASIIETNVRLANDEFIARNKLENHLIGVSTDAIISDIEVVLPQRNYFRMGDWRLSHISPALSVGAGQIWHGAATPNGISLEQALECIRAKPLNWHWNIIKSVPATPASLLRGEYAKIVDMKLGFRVPEDPERFFPELPANGQDLLERMWQSKALEIHR